MIVAVLVLARTLHIGSAMLLVALPFFILVTLRPAREGERRLGQAAFCARMITGLWCALGLEAVSGIVWLWFVTAQMNDASPWDILDAADLGTVLGQTQFGQLWLWRAALGLLLGIILFLLSRGKESSSTSRFWSWLFLIFSTGLLAMLAWAGHAASGTHFHALHILVDVTHLVLGSVWPMGLIPLFFFLWHSKSDDHVRPEAEAGEVLRRFSRMSLGAVVGLVGTGTVNSWLMVGSWEALVTTPYGRLLLGKILAVSVMIVLGGYNRLYLLPKWQEDSSVFRLLRQTILAEACFAVVVLLMVGIMGMTAPPF